MTILLASVAVIAAAVPGPPGEPPRLARQATAVWLRPSDCSRRDTRSWAKRLGSDPIGDGT